MNRIVVCLGSNIDKERNLPKAVKLLGQRCRLLAISAVYETAPVGLEAQPPFLNAAVLLESELDAAVFRREVLDPIERALDRVRTADKNAPRTIDADLTLFNDEILDLDNEHHIPDPDLLRFVHVAVPVADVAPEMSHPESGEALMAIAARLRRAAAAAGQAPLQQRPDVRLFINP